MTTRIAINGFGRVGRCAFRSALESGADVEWVAINDVADVATLAHLLRHDTVYGPFPGEVVVRGDRGDTALGSNHARITAEGSLSRSIDGKRETDPARDLQDDGSASVPL